MQPDPATSTTPATSRPRPPVHEGITELLGSGPWDNFVNHRGLDMVEEDAFRAWISEISDANKINVLYEYWLREIPQPADR